MKKSNGVMSGKRTGQLIAPLLSYTTIWKGSISNYWMIMNALYADGLEYYKK